MGFIAQVFSLFRKLSDVNWASITSSAPFLRYDAGTDKIVGAPVPTPSSPLILTANGATETPLVVEGAPAQAGTLLSVRSNYDGNHQHFPSFAVSSSAGDTVISVSNQSFLRAQSGTWYIESRPLAVTAGLQFGDNAYLQCSGGGGGAAFFIRSRDPNGGTSQGPVVIGDHSTSLPQGSSDPAANQIELARTVRMRSGFRFYQAVPASAPADADIPAGQMSIWVDESASELRFRVRMADGTYKTAYTALV